MHRFALSTLFDEKSCLRELWESSLLCDVGLKSVDGECFRAHKIILASVSPFFRALLTGTGQCMKDVQEALPSGEQVIQLKGVEGNALGAILDAVYRRQVEVCALICWECS